MEVSVKLEIPDGWELACDKMRPRKKGEQCLGNTGQVLAPALRDDDPSQTYNVILRPAWQWPEWLTAAAVVVTRDGQFWACSNVPCVSTEMGSGWENTGNTILLNGLFVALEPPQCTWRESLRVNPNRKASS